MDKLERSIVFVYLKRIYVELKKGSLVSINFQRLILEHLPDEHAVDLYLRLLNQLNIRYDSLLDANSFEETDLQNPEVKSLIEIFLDEIVSLEMKNPSGLSDFLTGKAPLFPGQPSENHDAYIFLCACTWEHQLFEYLNLITNESLALKILTSHFFKLRRKNILDNSFQDHLLPGASRRRPTWRT